jgi:hypothetical protein
MGLAFVSGVNQIANYSPQSWGIAFVIVRLGWRWRVRFRRRGRLHRRRGWYRGHHNIGWRVYRNDWSRLLQGRYLAPWKMRRHKGLDCCLKLFGERLWDMPPLLARCGQVHRNHKAFAIKPACLVCGWKYREPKEAKEKKGSASMHHRQRLISRVLGRNE